MEAIQKALLPIQNGIIAFVKLTATLKDDNTKNAANAILEEFRNGDEALRDRLFVLQVWRRYDHETAERMARRKAGEFEDPELAKVLEEREKRCRERDKERSRNQPKRFKSGASYYGYHPSGSYDNGPQSTGRGGHGVRGRRGNIRGSKRPSAENTRHKCGSSEHFYKTCPN